MTSIFPARLIRGRNETCHSGSGARDAELEFSPTPTSPGHQVVTLSRTDRR
ncbi:hypothetical protein ZHAS_00004604 [Anopheles sinensis]|uniref:Uncharacterized protein n=1 Tax=Anopheles sinensis TaxID=74873 RepID=A0A084VHM3_ANOSI|nr:hypothetical protein ZHAS_00004604 [Anopheles sinensis]